MDTFLVTGGAGFIGSHVVDALVDGGHDVRVLDNFATGDPRNLLHLRNDLDLVEGDVRSLDRVLAAVRGCEVVFHLAALPSVPRSIQDPVTTSEVNVTGTLNVLLACRDAGVRRVVYASSSSVYGNSGGGPKREDAPVSPLSPYGVSKHAGELYCASFHHSYGLETVSLRYFNVFGPRQSPFSEYAAAIPSFVSAALTGGEPTIHGDGHQTRDFTYVENVVHATMLAGDSSAATGEVFNVAYGEPHSVWEVVEQISDIAGRPLHPTYAPPRMGEIRKSAADIGKARERLGYEPTVDLTEGLRRTYAALASEVSLLQRVRKQREWLARADADGQLRSSAGARGR